MSDNLCGNCGANPCYHMCFNSPHYYSPEQERHDDQFYGEDDHRERYAATAEPSQYADWHDAGREPTQAEIATGLADLEAALDDDGNPRDNTDDIPF